MRIIREIGAGDLRAVAELHALSGSSGYRGMLSDEYLDALRLPQSIESWSRKLKIPSEEAYGLAAFDDATCIGLTFFEFDQDPVLGTLFATLHVHPEYRRQGIATGLAREAATRILARRPDGPLHVWTFKANTRARRLYDRMGGRVVHYQLRRGPDNTPIDECAYFWPSLTALLQTQEDYQEVPVGRGHETAP